MISGTVIGGRRAIIGIAMREPRGRWQEVEFVLDTGFTEELKLSPQIVQELSLPFRGLDTLELADGTLMTFLVYDAVVLWDGLERSVVVYAAEGLPLLGMALLEGNHVYLHIVKGGRVTITP